MAADPGVGRSTPFRIGEDADSDYPLGPEDDGSLPLGQQIALKGTRTDEVGEGTLRDTKSDLCVGGRPADGDRRRTIEEIGVGRRVGNVRRTSHRERTA